MKKKMLSILLMGFIVVGLTGCGNSSKEVNVASDLNKIHSNCISYGQSRDGVCAYKYALFYNNDNGNYYSVELDCENNDSNPNFANAKLLK